MECQSAVEFSVCSDGFCKCDESKNYFETSKAFADNRKISLRLENNDGEISTYCVSGKTIFLKMNGYYPLLSTSVRNGNNFHDFSFPSVMDKVPGKRGLLLKERICS